MTYSFNKELLIAKICDNLSQIMDNFSCTEHFDYCRKNGKLHQAVILRIDNSGGLIVKENNEEKYCIPKRLHLAIIRQVKKQNGNKY